MYDYSIHALHKGVKPRNPVHTSFVKLFTLAWNCIPPEERLPFSPQKGNLQFTNPDASWIVLD